MLILVSFALKAAPSGREVLYGPPPSLTSGLSEGLKFVECRVRGFKFRVQGWIEGFGV